MNKTAKIINFCWFRTHKKISKKAAIGISLKQLIGFVLFAIIFFAFIGFFVKLWGIFLDKPDQATINSFENLVYEIKSIEDGEERIVPYYIPQSYKLTTQLCQRTQQVKEDICICGIDNCKKNVIAKDYAEPKIELTVVGIENSTSIRGDSDKRKDEGVVNVKIARKGNAIIISEI